MDSKLDSDVKRVLNQMNFLGIPKMASLSVEGCRKLIEEVLSTKIETEDLDRVQNYIIPGKETQIPIRIYKPKNRSSEYNLIWFHGGGFVVGNLETTDPLCKVLANKLECTVVSVDYRLAPEYPFPASVEDSYRSTQWILENREILSGEKIVVGGTSAGGNLATVVSLIARDKNELDIDYQILVYPWVSRSDDWRSYEKYEEGYFLTVDDIEWFYNHYFDSYIHTKNPYAFPMNAKSLENLPPATIITCGFDPLKDQGKAYSERLKEEGVKVNYHNYEGMIHGFLSMISEVKKARKAIQDINKDLDSEISD